MSNPNVNLSNLDTRYSKPTDVSAAIAAQATTDAGQYAALQHASNHYRGGSDDLSRAYSSKPLFVSAYQSVPTANATTGATFTFRATHRLTQAVAGFRLVMPLGFNISSGQTATDVLWSGSTPVKVSIELAGAIRPVTFSGTRTKTNDPGGLLVSDLIAADLPAGTQVPVRVMVPTSTLYPNTVGTGQGPGATATGDGYTNGTDTSDAMTAVGVAITAGYFCHGLIGNPVSAPKPTVAFIGDSITMGTGDATNNGGWTAYASNGTVPNLRLAVGGAAAQGWIGGHSYSWPYLEYCTHAVVMLGANDLTNGNGPRTFSQFQADLTSIYTAMRNRGLKVYGCTVLPRTNSTDSWTTTTNQTPQSTAFAAGGSSTRGQINAWIRAGGGGLLNGYYETADVVETARDSGLWKPNYTTDGAHPVASAHQAIAAVVNLAALTI